MSYVVKVGEYYVRRRDILGDITLSKECMRCYGEDTAKRLAKKLNGELIEFKAQVTMDEYEQLSLFDEEVDNGK